LVGTRTGKSIGQGITSTTNGPVKIFPFGSWASNQGFRLGGDQSEGPVKRLVLAIAEMTNTPGRVATLR
jgi:hypothetical protein